MLIIFWFYLVEQEHVYVFNKHEMCLRIHIHIYYIHMYKFLRIFLYMFVYKCCTPRPWKVRRTTLRASKFIEKEVISESKLKGELEDVNAMCMIYTHT